MSSTVAGAGAIGAAASLNAAGSIAGASGAATGPPLASQTPLGGRGLVTGAAPGTATGATTGTAPATIPGTAIGTMAGTATAAGMAAAGTSAVSVDEQPLEQQAQLFRALLSNPLLAQEWASWSDSYNPATDDSIPAHPNAAHVIETGVPHNNIDVASLLASSAQPVNDTPASAAVADPEPTFAELVERHVRRTLAARATGRQEGDEVRLELTDAVLPDTSLSLRRSSAGWQLTAVTGDRGSLERLEQFTPALVKRFANASLGSLEVVARLETRSQ